MCGGAQYIGAGANGTVDWRKDAGLWEEAVV